MRAAMVMMVLMCVLSACGGNDPLGARRTLGPEDTRRDDSFRGDTFRGDTSRGVSNGPATQAAPLPPL